MRFTLLFRPTNGSFISRRTHLRDISLRIFVPTSFPGSGAWPTATIVASTIPRLTGRRGGEYREFSNTPYVYMHARMYTYR